MKGADVAGLEPIERARRELAALVKRHPELTRPEARARLAGLLAKEGIVGADVKLDELLNIRVEADVLARCDKLAEALPMGRPDIVRAALRLGVAALEKDRALVLAPDAMPRPTTKAKGKR